MRTLKDDRDFFYAALSGSRVSIYQNGNLNDYGGTVESYSEVSIKIRGTYYIRSFYEFRIIS